MSEGIGRSRGRRIAIVLGLALGAPLLAGTTASPAAVAAVAADDAPVAIVAAERETVAARAEAIVADMDTRTLAGTIVLGHYGMQSPETAVRYLSENRVGGFLLMGSNPTWDEARLREFTAALRGDAALPALVAIDQEGGSVSRLGWDGFPAGRALADLDPAEAEAAFAARGSLVARTGTGANFGVVADATADPWSFIGPRVLGAEPEAAAERVAAATAGEAPYALTTLKHFPGHGQVAEDSHYVIPVTEQSYDDWRATTARPFEAGIEAGASLVMTGHLVYSQVSEAPASLSPEWYRILREDLGFTGVAVTDDLGMLLSSGDPRYTDHVANAVEAVAAGADLVVHVVRSGWTTAAEIADGIAGAAEAGLIPEARLREAAQRVVALRLELSGQSVLLPAEF